MLLNKKILLLLLLIALYFSLCLNNVYALSASERGIIKSETDGSSEISFELDISEIPKDYGIKITSDLNELSMQPKGIDNYTFNDNILIIYPQNNKFTVKISGKTPSASYEESYKGLIFIKLNENEYLYYRVVVIDENRRETELLEDEKKFFILNEPKSYMDIKRKINSMQNEKLKEHVQELFNHGLINVACELAEAESNTGNDHFWGFREILFLLIFFVIGISIGLFIYHIHYKKSDKDNVKV